MATSTTFAQRCAVGAQQVGERAVAITCGALGFVYLLIDPQRASGEARRTLGGWQVRSVDAVPGDERCVAIAPALTMRVGRAAGAGVRG